MERLNRLAKLYKQQATRELARTVDYTDEELEEMAYVSTFRDYTD